MPVAGQINSRHERASVRLPSPRAISLEALRPLCIPLSATYPCSKVGAQSGRDGTNTAGFQVNQSPPALEAAHCLICGRSAEKDYLRTEEKLCLASYLYLYRPRPWLRCAWLCLGGISKDNFWSRVSLVLSQRTCHISCRTITTTTTSLTSLVLRGCARGCDVILYYNRVCRGSEGILPTFGSPCGSA